MLETTERHRRCCRVQCCVRGGAVSGPALALRRPCESLNRKSSSTTVLPCRRVPLLQQWQHPEHRGLRGGAGPSRVWRIRAVTPPFAGHLSAGRGAAAAAEELAGVQHTHQTRMNRFLKSLCEFCGSAAAVAKYSSRVSPVSPQAFQQGAYYCTLFGKEPTGSQQYGPEALPH